MTVFAFWFDSNKEQHYPFLGTRVIRGLRFFNDIHDPGQLYIIFIYIYMGRCPAKSPFWSLNFITIKIVHYTKQHIFTTVLYFLFKFCTLVHTSVLSVQTDFGALDIFHAMVANVSNPMG